MKEGNNRASLKWIAAALWFLYLAGLVKADDTDPQYRFSQLQRQLEADPGYDPGYCRAWYEIGIMYESVTVTRQNKVRARQSCQEAIARVNVPALHNPHSIYAQQNDYGRALKWRKAAAERNRPQARFNLGMLYEKGWGLERNAEMAVQWYRAVAESALEKYYSQYRNASHRFKARPQSPNIGQPYVQGRTGETGGLRQIVRGVMSAMALIPSAHAQADVPALHEDAQGWKWLYLQPENRYTIQLFATRDRSKTGKFIKQYALTDRAVVLPADVKGSRYYKVILGSFPQWNDAAVEIGGLPQDLREQRPWIRKFSTFYSELPDGVDITTAAGTDGETPVEQAMVSPEETTLTTDDMAAGGADQLQKPDTPENTSPSDPVPDKSKTVEEDTGSFLTDESRIDGASTDQRESVVETGLDESGQHEPEVESGHTPIGENGGPVTPPGSQVVTKLFVTRDADPVVVKQLQNSLALLRSGQVSQAVDELAPLSDSGMAEAQYNLAMLYSSGNGVALNSEKAFGLMKQAAEQGHPYAQMELARFYSQGIGIEASPALGNYWMQTAEDNLKRLQDQ